jgi:hypothetical protein
MRRTDLASKQVHYSHTAPVSKITMEGYGVCCTRGLVTGYGGLVTCPECKAVYEDAKAAVRQILNTGGNS